MTLSSWLSSWTANLKNGAGRRRIHGRQRVQFVEVFESRTLLTTFTVTTDVDTPATTADSGPLSEPLTLRQAILDANANPGADTIAFNIPGAGVHTISPLSTLPTVTDPVIIDGYSQPGASANSNGPGFGDNAVLQIELDGSLAGSGASGLIVTAGDSTIQGFAINSFDYFGISLATLGNNKIAGNFIGTDATGTSAKPNRDSGIYLGSYGGTGSSNGNTIGGLTPSSRNIISGNGGTNLHIEPSNGNAIQGNFVGVDATGTVGLSTNTHVGIFVYGNNNTIGGITQNARNIISGISAGYGILIDESVRIGNKIQGNYIGTDVSGGNAVANNFGIVDSDGSTIGGLTNTPGANAGNVISGNTELGVFGVHGVIQGNLIGTDASGRYAVGNGVGAFVSQETVGGTTSDARNVISGNVDGVRAVGNAIVQGNYIGTDVNGTSFVGNLGMGVYITAGPNQIGGAAVGARNVIAGSRTGDIRLQTTSGDVIQGNYIGVDKSGNHPLTDYSGSDGFGVLVDAQVTDLRIGTPGAGNVIGRCDVGIAIHSTDTSGVLVQGNSLGLGPDGVTPIANRFGISLYGGTANNTIGGTSPDDGNIIANSLYVAVGIDQYFQAPITTGNAILGNSIYNTQQGVSSGLGIDIARSIDSSTDGPNPNDPLDADVGNNNLQNYPILTNVVNGASTTSIQGTLNSVPNSTFRIEFFSNSTAMTNGYSEGERYLGFANVTTDASGNASFNVALATSSTAGQYITSTATDSANNTSEFSLAFQAPLNSPPIANAGGPYAVVRGGSVTLDAHGSSDPDQSNTTLVYSWDLDGDGVFGETGTGASRGDEVGMNPVFSAVGLNTAGVRTVSLKVTDAGGLTSSLSTATVNVALTGLVDDPLAPGKTMLVIGGSTGNDTIRISVEEDHHDCHDDDAEFITVRINEHDEAHHKIRGTFALPVSRIVVYAQAGNDDVKMDDDSTIPAWLYGGDGNDRLQGGGGNDVLLGGAGNDLLSGDDGRDLLIGGTGADRIIGNAGDDIMIAGTTNHDAIDLEIYSIMREWTRTDASFLARVAHLENGDGWNAGYRLIDATVHDDHAEDVLTGSDGNDWFLFNHDGDGGVKDKGSDLSTFEALYAMDIDWLST